MFKINPCAAGCGRPAVTGYNLCFIHLANPEQEYKRICEFIEENKSIKDVCISGVRFENTDFSAHQIFGCNFREASFIHCNFTGVVTRMSFFDFATFNDCDFSKSDLQFASFAGTRVNNCTFEGSEIVHVNFEGAAIAGSRFDNSNLYNSRFISADLEKTTFINCNLKQVYFISAKQKDIFFKSSNTAEAVFEMEES